MLTYIQNLVCSFKMFSRLNSDSNQGPLQRQNFAKKIMGSNLKLDLVNIDVHTKIGQILSIRSQDIEQKLISEILQGPQLFLNFVKYVWHQSKGRSYKC